MHTYRWTSREHCWLCVGQVVSSRQMQLCIQSVSSRLLLMAELCCCFEESESDCNGPSCAPACLPLRFTTHLIYSLRTPSLSHNCTLHAHFLPRLSVLHLHLSLSLSVPLSFWLIGILYYYKTGHILLLLLNVVTGDYLKPVLLL